MYAKEILNACCLSQATTDKDKFYVSLKYNALSLRDCFWIKTSEEQTWGEINLFQNSLQNGIFLLKGEIPGTDAVRKEVEASQILKEFGFDVVDYEKDFFDGMTVSKSKCYTSLDCNIVSAEGYMENNSINLPYQVVYSETVSQERVAIDAIRKRNLHLKKIDFSKYYYGEYVKARYEKMKER